MRAITLRELAQQYFPHSTAHSAVTQLRGWLLRNKPLVARLTELSYKSRQRTLTPLQHEAYLYYLGEPGE